MLRRQQNSNVEITDNDEGKAPETRSWTVVLQSFTAPDPGKGKKVSIINREAN